LHNINLLVQLLLYCVLFVENFIDVIASVSSKTILQFTDRSAQFLGM